MAWQPRPRRRDILPPAVSVALERLGDTRLFGPISAVARLGWLFFRELDDDKAFSRAAAMSYATLVAVVPVLVLVFGVLGGMGLLDDPEDQQLIYDALFGTFFGDVAEIRTALSPFLRQIDFRALGLVSTGALLVVAGRLFLMVERAYSDIFKVRITRPLGQRILNFYFATTAVPLVLVATVQSALGPGGGGLIGALPVVPLVQLLLLAVALRFFPCTAVRWRAVALGASVSWIGLQGASWAFATYLTWTYAAPDYPLRAFYGSLILVPIVLLWLYLFWVIILLGVEVAHVTQNHGNLLASKLEAVDRDAGLRCASVEDAALVLAHVGRAFERGQGPVPAEGLLAATGLRERPLRDIADTLVEAELLIEAGEGWTLARPARSIRMADVAERWRVLTSLSRRTPEAEVTLPALVHADGTLADAIEAWFDGEPG